MHGFRKASHESEHLAELNWNHGTMWSSEHHSAQALLNQDAVSCEGCKMVSTDTYPLSYL